MLSPIWAKVPEHMEQLTDVKEVERLLGANSLHGVRGMSSSCEEPLLVSVAQGEKSQTKEQPASFYALPLPGASQHAPVEMRTCWECALCDWSHHSCSQEAEHTPVLRSLPSL